MGVLRAEIRRLARKETRDEIRALRKMLTSMRRRLAEARRRMDSFERTAKLAIAKRAVGASAGIRDAVAEKQVRFSPAWLRMHRKRLHLSRKAYGRLVGVSAQSILSWETGRARPRRKVLQVWRDMREKGVRELRSLLKGSGARRVRVGEGRKRRVARRKARRTRRAVRKVVRSARRTRRVARRTRRVVRRAVRKTVRAKKK
jgi:DNA-binding transcriptional regulator YiaG